MHNHRHHSITMASVTVFSYGPNEVTGDRERSYASMPCTRLGIYETNHDNPRTHHLPQAIRLRLRYQSPLLVHHQHMGCDAFQYITNGDFRLCLLFRIISHVVLFIERWVPQLHLLEQIDNTVAGWEVIWLSFYNRLFSMEFFSNTCLIANNINTIVQNEHTIL